MQECSLKPFDEMTPGDYAAIGFKSGLEIHQQLRTDKKLFCRCPAAHYSREHDAEILRHMRPTLSELGEYDGTALMEFKTHKEIIYLIHHDSVCTYEMDDTPPFELNEEALDIALGIGMLYGCSMVDELHISRKQYLDGSIPTGFQRTTIVGVDGSVPYGHRKIRIVQLGLEEDACREVSDIGHRRLYRTDRLGMPLIETVTAPDMRTPREVAEVADILRYLVRSTGKVRTGLGAARQDVNVSVEGGTRIEIKGVSRIPLIPLLTYNEAMRQWNLLRLREKLKSRGIDAASFRSESRDVTKLLRGAVYQPVRNAVVQGMIVKAVKLCGFRGLLRWQTQTSTSFSQEISDRVRVVACLTTLPNIIHSDSPSETLSSSEWRAVKKTLDAGEDDTVVLVWGSLEDASTGAAEIVIRAREATIGIPSETRQAHRDGTNGFERILPGPDRMYPDTDLPPKRVTGERLERLRAGLPEPFWERESWYARLGIPRDVVRPLAISRFAVLFEKTVREGGVDPTLAAVAMVQFMKRLGRKGAGIDKITPEIMGEIFDAFRKGLISSEGIFLAMKGATEDAHRRDGFPGMCSEAEIDETLQALRPKLVEMNPLDGPGLLNAAMGMAMETLRGRVDGAALAQRVERLIRKEK